MHCTRHLLVAALLLAGLSAAPAQAQSDYPSRPVRLIVGFGPGSSADITARVVANRMSITLGQQVVVENRTGAGSSIAAEFVARAPKDGYTLFIGTSANATNAAMNPNLAFNFVNDFAPIALLTSAPVILVVNPSVPANSVQELIALAKQKPGEITYGSTGVGTSPHLSAELFAARAGIKLVHVPYQGSPQVATDLLAGRIAMTFSVASAVLPHIEQRTLKALASATSKRPAVAPNVPTMAEAGLPDFDTSIWFGLVAPAGTPREIVDKLSRAANEALKSSEALATFKTQGFDALGNSPDEFAAHIRNDMGKWAAAAEAAGLKK
jgi:tripartite-type tricarboxylate transporter receptor subunit TctC